MAFFDDLFQGFTQGFIQQSGQTISTAANNLIQSFSVPAPVNNDPYILNQYSKDVREQTPAYQQYALQQMQERTQQNILITAVAVGLGLLMLL